MFNNQDKLNCNASDSNKSSQKAGSEDNKLGNQIRKEMKQTGTISRDWTVIGINLGDDMTVSGVQIADMIEASGKDGWTLDTIGVAFDGVREAIIEY